MASFLTDEHVPSVFVTTLRSNGHEVIPANDVFGESTDDRALLEHCATEGYVFVSNDKKDFTGTLPADVDHDGILLSTDPNYLRDDPESAAATVERILSHYPPSELRGSIVWLDRWRR